MLFRIQGGLGRPRQAYPGQGAVSCLVQHCGRQCARVWVVDEPEGGRQAPVVTNSRRSKHHSCVWSRSLQEAGCQLLLLGCVPRKSRRGNAYRSTLAW